MKAATILRVNAIVLIAAGIAFGLYGPLMMAFFAVPELLNISSDLYWQIASFARMFGAATFALGLLIWALRDIFPDLAVRKQRGLLAALILGHLMGGFVSITQTSSIWGTAAGWLTTGLFAVFLLAYIYAIASLPSDKPGEEAHVEDAYPNS